MSQTFSSNVLVQIIPSYLVLHSKFSISEDFTHNFIHICTDMSQTFSSNVLVHTISEDQPDEIADVSENLTQPEKEDETVQTIKEEQAAEPDQDIFQPRIQGRTYT